MTRSATAKVAGLEAALAYPDGKGFTVIDRESFGLADIGMASQAAKLKAAGPQLVFRINDRPQQTDGDRLDALAFHRTDDFEHRRFIECLPNRAIGKNAAGSFECQRARHVGLGIRNGKIEGLGPTAFAQGQDIGMSGRCEERGASRIPGDDRVDRVGRAVNEHFAATEKFG